MYRWCITSKMNKINNFKIKRLTWGKRDEFKSSRLYESQCGYGSRNGSGLTIPVKNVVAAESEIKWDKGVCRFCGTGCAVLVGTKDGRVVASQGDPDAEVNRGLNCIKGYFLPKIMYGKDRLTQPLLRMTNGKFDKNGDFAPVSWDFAFKTMAEKFKEAFKRTVKMQ